MLNVFLTIDTEIWPFSPGWPVRPLASDKLSFSEEIDTYLYGKTTQGEYGIPFQMAILNRYGLKATYFLEPLFADKVGIACLSEVVGLIQNGGHEVQLHMHTEWLSEISDASIPARFKQYMHQFSLEEQTALIGKGIRNLQAAGVKEIRAFRAGSYGANLDTLRAALNNGLSFDSSHNFCYLGTDCKIYPSALMLQPQKMEGIWEFPISFFQDYPGHYRHTQLAACAFNELKTALLDAWQAGWFSFVIVLHSFELIKGKTPSILSLPDKTNIKRFRLLCEFLATHPDKFRTVLFSEIDTASIPEINAIKPLRSRFHHTARRFVEQGIARLT